MLQIWQKSCANKAFLVAEKVSPSWLEILGKRHWMASWCTSLDHHGQVAHRWTSAQTMCGTGFSNLQSMSYGRCAFGSQMSSPFPTNQEKMKLLSNDPFNYVFPITRGKAAQGISLMAIHYKIYLSKIQMAVVLMCPLRLNVSVLPRTTSRWENKDQTAQIWNVTCFYPLYPGMILSGKFRLITLLLKIDLLKF